MRIYVIATFLIFFTAVFTYKNFNSILFETGFFNREAYCTMSNGCPLDKCYEHADCLPGSNGISAGCSPGPTQCSFKSQLSKFDYKQISFEEARTCLKDFVKKNVDKFPHLARFNLDLAEEKMLHFPGTQEDKDEESPADRFWYVFSLNALPDRDGADVRVGAQTCHVKWPTISRYDEPKKTNTDKANKLITLAEAKVCAEDFLKVNYGDTPEGQLFIEGESLLVSNQIDDNSNENIAGYYMFSIDRRKFIYVGSKNCVVYKNVNSNTPSSVHTKINSNAPSSIITNGKSCDISSGKVCEAKNSDLKINANFELDNNTYILITNHSNSECKLKASSSSPWRGDMIISAKSFLPTYNPGVYELHEIQGQICDLTVQELKNR